MGAVIGGGISLVVNGTWMLVVASGMCALTTGYTYFHQDRRARKA
ncbi:putative transmembrane protein [Mycobacterium tuberculosis]|nr:putative transmembrane protein [Mycobacterium tuberculosis]